MPKGLFLIKKDDKKGIITDLKYPDKIEISIGNLTKYLATIQIISNSPALQIREVNQITLIQIIGLKEMKTGQKIFWEFLLLILDETESTKTEYYQLKLRYLSEILSKFEDNPIPRKQKFLEVAHQIINPSFQKIVFIGFPNSGKTSTKQFLFEKVNQNEILNTTIVPTEGVDTVQYQFLDMNISLFDTSGQELDRWYEESEVIFEMAEMVIFFFSISNWIDNPEQVKRRINQQLKIKSVLPNANFEILLFCHKMDLLLESNESVRQEIIAFAKESQLQVFFTSLKEGGNDDLHLGVQKIVDKFSHVYSILNILINQLITGSNFRPLFLFNMEFQILINYDKNRVINQFRNPIQTLYSSICFQIQKNMKSKAQFLILNTEDNSDIYIALNINAIFPDFSYIILINSDKSPLDPLISKYEELIQSLKGSVIDQSIKDKTE